MDRVSIDLVAAIIAAVTTVAWFINLQSRVKAVEVYAHTVKKDVTDQKKEIEAILIKHEALDNRIFTELARIRESLVRLETVFTMIDGTTKTIMKEREKT